MHVIPWPPGRPAFARSSIGLLLVAVCLAGLQGCVALPERPVAPASTALPATGGSALDKVANASIRHSGAGPGESAFRLVQSGTHALDARIALARSAQRSLDVQYYHVAGDNTGRGFLRELRDAAARGVRVRLLVDDLYTSGEQDVLAGLAAFDHVEVRIFNPFPVRDGSLGQRFVASLASFGRLQMRMHNKLLVADGSVAIGGGRNIADEYFWQSRTDAFVDFDILLTGPVIGDLASLFDRYWNSERVWPVQDLSPPVAPATGRGRFDAWVADAKLPAAPAKALDLLGYGRIADELRAGVVRLQHGRVRAVADSPLKVDTAGDKRIEGGGLWAANTETRRLYNGLLRDARTEVTMISPYTVPGPAGIARLQALHDRGVVARVLTNSLSSTDEPVVHTGYRRYREKILATGTGLYELDAKPSAGLVLDEMQGDPVLHIHVKSAVFDRRTTYLGSMNFDPRSAAINTEIALVIDSEALAADVLTLVDTLIREGAWHVQVGPDGQVQWRKEGRDAETSATEPRTSSLQRTWVDVLSWIVPEGVL